MHNSFLQKLKIIRLSKKKERKDRSLKITLGKPLVCIFLSSAYEGGLVTRTRCNATPLIVIISVAIGNLLLENIMKHVLFRFKERRFAENHSLKLILCSLAFKVLDNKKGQ